MSLEKEEITVFDDGSDESKVLLHECQKNPQITTKVLQVSGGIEEWFSKLQLPPEAKKGEEPNKPLKIWLHFTNDHHNGPDLDKTLNKIKSQFRDKKGNPQLSIYGPYQNMDQRHVLYRGIQYGVLKDPSKGESMSIPEAAIAEGGENNGQEEKKTN